MKNSREDDHEDRQSSMLLRSVIVYSLYLIAMALATHGFITRFLELELISDIIMRGGSLLCGVNLLGEDLLKLLGCSLLDALRNLAGAGGVANLAGLLV